MFKIKKQKGNLQKMQIPNSGEMVSFVEKAHKLMVCGKIDESQGVLLNGLDSYQKKVLDSVNPFPAKDAALMVVVMWNLANSIYLANPLCRGLANKLFRDFNAPEFHLKEGDENS